MLEVLKNIQVCYVTGLILKDYTILLIRMPKGLNIWLILHCHKIWLILHWSLNQLFSTHHCVCIWRAFKKKKKKVHPQTFRFGFGVEARHVELVKALRLFLMYGTTDLKVHIPRRLGNVLVLKYSLTRDSSYPIASGMALVSRE